jgi:transposase
MPVKCVSRLIKVNDDRLWRMIDKYIERAHAEQDLSELVSVGMDETSRAKYHQYVTLFVDLNENRTVYVAEGKGHETVADFATVLTQHGGDPLNITDVSCDISPAFIKGVRESLPEAQITFDKFHVIKLINMAVDEIRRGEVATQPILKNARFVVLKNNDNLTESELAKLEEMSLSKLNLKTVRAMRIRECFQEIYNAPTEEAFEILLKKWYFWATHSRLEPIIRVAKTIKAHWDGILEWKRSQINNGILEGLNSVIQAAKAKARGFKTFKYFKIVIFLTTGKLDFCTVNSHCKCPVS